MCILCEMSHKKSIAHLVFRICKALSLYLSVNERLDENMKIEILVHSTVVMMVSGHSFMRQSETTSILCCHMHQHW